MTLNDYREQFKRNMMVMSRTANGRLDLSASATKKDSMAAGTAEEAQSLALGNADRAIAFLFDNRMRYFGSARELEELVLETAKITNKGIVRDDRLFRSGEDSTKFNYARIRDIPAMWDWFVLMFYWMLTSQNFEVEEIAAFSEYVIHSAAHFFTENCGIIAMLVSTYVFMRFDLPCPEYTSEDEYYRAAARGKVPTAGEMYTLLADAEFWNFVSYYLSLCPSRDITRNDYVEELDDGIFICRLTGQFTGARERVLRQIIADLYAKHGDVFILFDCTTLAWIDMEGISILADLRASGKRFALRNLNADCRVLFKVEGFDEYLQGDDKLPKIDLSGCEKINEGASGIIYKLSDEMAAKTFKDKPDYYDIVRRRIAQKNALIAGVPAPFSFGYAEYDGGIVTLMELIRSRSLLQVIVSEKDHDGYIIRFAQFVRQLHEIRDEEKLRHFDRNLLGEEILSKADRCDPFLKKEYRGMARKIIEAINEPECLVHGDIHPKNIMTSEDEMLFIDFDYFSTGKAIYDLGTLYRTLLCNQDEEGASLNSFLDISMDECRKIWDMFIAEYYKDEPEETVRNKVAEARLIGTVLNLARFIKIEMDAWLISKWAVKLERILEEW